MMNMNDENMVFLNRFVDSVVEEYFQRYRYNNILTREQWRELVNYHISRYSSRLSINTFNWRRIETQIHMREYLENAIDSDIRYRLGLPNGTAYTNNRDIGSSMIFDGLSGTYMRVQYVYNYEDLITTTVELLEMLWDVDPEIIREYKPEYVITLFEESFKVTFNEKTKDVKSAIISYLKLLSSEHHSFIYKDIVFKFLNDIQARYKCYADKFWEYRLHDTLRKRGIEKPHVKTNHDKLEIYL